MSLDKLAEDTVAALADETVQATIDHWSGESFVDGEDWPIFRSVARTVIAAFWRYHLAVVTPGSETFTTAHDTFCDLLKTWEVHMKKQMRRTCELAFCADRKAHEDFYFKLSTQERERDEDVETVPLSEEFDRGDVLFRSAPASSSQTSPKPEERK